MSRTAAFLVGLLAVTAARADIAVPPPPGKKFVQVDYVLTTAKSYPEHEFYVVIGTTPKKVEFGPETPVKIDGNRGGLYGSRGQFVAVPKGAAEKFPSEKAFADAVAAGKVPGQANTKKNFDPRAAIDAKDARTAVVETYAVEKIEAKGGIVLKAAKAPASPAPGKGDKNAPDDETEFTADEVPAPALAPRGGAVVAGLAAALALAFAGVRLARRARS